MSDAMDSVSGSCGSADMHLVRFLTCGSVDDGKSTLIGRLLYDTGSLPADQLGSLGESKEFSSLLDGLEAEKEQGITIDVAYRYFATSSRRFIMADTPGHEQYTRNMATGASTADAAIILMDARKGVLPQTRLHTSIAHLLRVRHVILAVNKMDLIDYSPGGYQGMVSEYSKVSDALGFDSVAAIPVSARHGDNVVVRSERMDWYDGPTVLEVLETMDVSDVRRKLPLRLPVQLVVRADDQERGYAGSVVSGTVRPGDRVMVAGSGRSAKVESISTVDGRLSEAEAGDAVVLTLEDQIDISRGDVIASDRNPPMLSQQFAANILWMDEESMQPGRSYLLRTGSQEIPATVTRLTHRLQIDTLEHRPARVLGINEIGKCNIRTVRPIAFDAYQDIRRTGSFILIDRYRYQTVGAGMILHRLDRADNIRSQPASVDRHKRRALKGHGSFALWFTGLSGSGKSTLADLVERALVERGIHTMLLDGDNIRHGLNTDLGFTDADRVENIRRIGHVVKLFVDAGIVVICSFISPFRAERRMVRELLEEGEFFEIFVDTPLEECIKRDPKGLYSKATEGKIRNFTGVDSPYEVPQMHDMRIETLNCTPGQASGEIVDMLYSRGMLDDLGS